MSTENAYAWRPTDLEGIRAALSIPVSPASIRAINDEMAALERHYPDAIPVAKGHIDAIALIDYPPEPSEPGPPATPEPVVRKVTRKGAAGPVPEQLPQRKLDVVEYATELLLEEVSTEYEIPPQASEPAARPAASRRRHVEALLLILPGLTSWLPAQQPRFGGLMIRG